jgi:hypothetical protein
MAAEHAWIDHFLPGLAGELSQQRGLSTCVRFNVTLYFFGEKIHKRQKY